MKNINWKGVARWHSFRGHHEKAEIIWKSMNPKPPTIKDKELGELLFERESEAEINKKIKEMVEEKND
jgi:hypothetical protein